MSENGRCWFNSGSQKNNTGLVKTLQYVLSTFELFLVLFLLFWLVRWTTTLPFLSQSRQPSAVFSTTWLRQRRTLRRPSRAVLHVLHRQETPPFIDVLTLRDARFLRANWHSRRKRKLTFLSMTTIDIPKGDRRVPTYLRTYTYVHTHIPRIDSSFKASRCRLSFARVFGDPAVWLYPSWRARSKVCSTQIVCMRKWCWKNGKI